MQGNVIFAWLHAASTPHELFISVPDARAHTHEQVAGEAAGVGATPTSLRHTR